MFDFFSFAGNCGDGVFENKKILAADIEQHGKFVKTFYSARQGRAVQQMNDDVKFFTPRRI